MCLMELKLVIITSNTFKNVELPNQIISLNFKCLTTFAKFSLFRYLSGRDNTIQESLWKVPCCKI